jgi:hypothetical protein
VHGVRFIATMQNIDTDGFATTRITSTPSSVDAMIEPCVAVPAGEEL